MNRRLHALAPLGIAITLAACQHAAPRPAAMPESGQAPVAAVAEVAPVAPVAPIAPIAPVGAPPSTADDNLNAVLWMQRAVEYRAVSAEVYRAATAQLDRALHQTDWDALLPAERDRPAKGLKPAVILDVDETVLDNTPYQARLVRDNTEYAKATWDAWVREQRARAVPGAVAFTQAAAAKGVTVIYLSNRAAELSAPTLANLRAAGLPVANDGVFLGLGTPVDGCESRGSEKECRRRLVSRSYRVLMQFGDQLGDFLKVPENLPATHAALYAQYGNWFGERWWMVPNPSYGAWEAGLFGNDYKQPRDARRAAKRAQVVTE